MVKQEMINILVCDDFILLQIHRQIYSIEYTKGSECHSAGLALILAIGCDCAVYSDWRLQYNDINFELGL